MLKFILPLLLLLFSSQVFSLESLRRTPNSLYNQNRQADLEGLKRLTERDLDMFIHEKILVPLPHNNVTVVVDSRLPKRYRYCLPETRDFLIDFGTYFRKETGKPIQINSAIRTVEYQEYLRNVKRNGNAAKSEGPKRSSHLTGATIDIAKKDMTPHQLKTARKYLLFFRKNKLADVTEEFDQPVFHAMIFRSKYKEFHEKFELALNKPDVFQKEVSRPHYMRASINNFSRHSAYKKHKRHSRH